MAIENFKYNSLEEGEIRVLVLDAAAQEGDALSGALVVVKHIPGDHITRYDAMSYTWGDQSDPEYIDLRHPRPIGHDKSCICNKESSGSLAIGRNLASALRKIRHQSNNQILWADSICINQQDLDERAAQVLRMRDIYKYAQRVIGRSAIEIIAAKREALAGTVDIHTMVEFSNARSFSALRHLRDFFSLVAYTHACEVTEPRDRVFALLGLAEGGFTSEIVVDYRKDVKDVHRDALVRASTYHQDLKLMSLCDSASEPTWIPDLERIQLQRPMTYGRAALCCAENGHAFTKEQLLLQGIRCDYISELVGPQGSQNCQAQLQTTVLEAAQRFLGPHPETWDFQKVQQFSLMLHVNDFFIHPPFINKTHQQLAQRISTHSKTLGGQLAHLTYYMHNRSIYLTKMGYIVLGPRDCQPNDLIVVFLGCHLPMVLRSIEDGEYKLKGPCAHPALLAGEAILGEMPKGWRLSYSRRGENSVFEDPEGKRHHIDPRLDGMPVPEEWELRWRNNGTPFWYIAAEDRWTNFDPRISLEGLRKRGVRVNDYVLR
ncbi:uncharacterized protein FPRO_05527 [Fusarium proliferatum ET1]|uniref:Heterokaryon incompatibility domain-containing protein n=1 Tax=Fusarium proliferatum (strain ET1) TaxID=1227346 RepID=A0A1L7VF54_FUSPR|nr:uncharacterized protein FPRO_05527 [Fusarium proliferatum ET1]CZR39281.1 uncharacterized protein FPRO_05527 [Fusarium proliferatum ET1]